MASFNYSQTVDEMLRIVYSAASVADGMTQLIELGFRLQTLSV